MGDAARMAKDAAAENRPNLVDDDGAFDVDRAAPPLQDAGDGCTVLRCVRRRDGMVLAAHLTAPGRVVRADMIRRLSGLSTEGVLVPIGVTSVSPGGPVPPLTIAVVTPPPPGPSLLTLLAAGRLRLTEAEAMETVLLPLAAALRSLHMGAVTHRGVRLGNVFLASGKPVMLGQAWSAPPACLQPAIYETPEAAMCVPAGRGDGMPADDIYALGVVLLHLILGRRAEAPGADIIARKLEAGSLAAVLEPDRLPPRTAELIRAMLADDPGHRPTAAMLCDTKAQPGRRVAARAARRAAVPLEVGATQAWNARGAAYALMSQADGPEALRDGRVDRWLRRGLGEPSIASGIDELLKPRPGATDGTDDAWQLMNAVALLDPMAPVCWRGTVVSPDGVFDALADAMGTDPARPANPTVLARLEEAVAQEAIAAHAALTLGERDPALLRDRLATSRRARAMTQYKGLTGGKPRALYLLNPAVPCLSPLMGGRAASDLSAVLAALEAQSAASADAPLVEPHLLAFIAARSEPLARTLGGGDAIGLLRALVEVQRPGRGRTPALCRRFARVLRDELNAWQHVPTREKRAAALQAAVDAGELTELLHLVEEPRALAADRQGAARAQATIAHCNAVLARLNDAPEIRAAQARATGREIAAGAGLSVFATLLLVAILG